MNDESYQHFNDAGDFLAALSSTFRLWNGDPTAWIFRGQADDTWDLRPKAVRSPELFVEHGIRGPALGWTDRRERLVELLERFQRGLDRLGIPTPAEQVDVRDEAGTTIHYGDVPRRALFPLMALAAHHDLPTLLLDWSRRPRVAAYFAAYFAVHSSKKEPGDNIVVWGLRRGHGNRRWGSHAKRAALYFYEGPGETNPNMRAQSGLFSLLSSDSDLDVREMVQTLQREGAEYPFLTHITLPKKAAPRLLRLLSYEGIDNASLFPGADGVVRSMREQTKWDLQPGESP